MRSTWRNTIQHRDHYEFVQTRCEYMQILVVFVAGLGDLVIIAQI